MQNKDRSPISNRVDRRLILTAIVFLWIINLILLGNHANHAYARYVVYDQVHFTVTLPAMGS